METDRVAAPFQHHAFEIVVQYDTGNTVPCGKRGDVAAQEVLHPGVREEAQEDLARMAQHHDERHQWAACAADLKMAEMSPVDLRLFAGETTQSQIRLSLRTRPMAGDHVAEVIRAAAIAALAHHHIQPTGGQRRKRIQRLADERQIRVDLRRPGWRADPGQPRLSQHARHHAMMHVQLTGDGADAPLLGVVVAQDLRLDVRRRDHGLVLSGRVAPGRDDRGGGAGTPDGRIPGSDARTNGSAMSRAGAAPPGSLRRSRSPASWAATDHPAAARVNRDASHFCSAPDSDASARHARAAPDGWSDSAARQHAARDAGLARRSLRHSRFARDRNSCRSSSGRGNRHTQTAGLTQHRHVRSCRRHVDESLDCRDYCPCMRAQHGVGHGVDAEPPSCARRRACPSLPERYPATPLRVRPRTPRTAASPLTTCRHLSSNCGQARPCAGYHVTRSGSSRQKSAGPDSRRHMATEALVAHVVVSKFCDSRVSRTHRQRWRCGAM